MGFLINSWESFWIVSTSLKESKTKVITLTSWTSCSLSLARSKSVFRFSYRYVKLFCNCTQWSIVFFFQEQIPILGDCEGAARCTLEKRDFLSKVQYERVPLGAERGPHSPSQFERWEKKRRFNTTTALSARRAPLTLIITSLLGGRYGFWQINLWGTTLMQVARGGNSPTDHQHNNFQITCWAALSNYTDIIWLVSLWNYLRAKRKVMEAKVAAL